MEQPCSLSTLHIGSTPYLLLYAVLALVSVDEVDDHLLLGPCSAAKKTDADFRISLARLSSRSSARSLRISAAILLVTPGRWPASVGALRI